MSENDASRILVDIVHQILSKADPYELRVWALEPKDQACLQAHFGLGTWIRHEWIYSNTPSVAQLRSVAPTTHDDDMSALILMALWDVLNGEPCPPVIFPTPFMPSMLCWDE